MKIIKVDNYDRDYIDDILIAENVHHHYANDIVEYLNLKEHHSSPYFYRLVDDEYKLKKWEP